MNRAAGWAAIVLAAVVVGAAIGVPSLSPEQRAAALLAAIGGVVWLWSATRNEPE